MLTIKDITEQDQFIIDIKEEFVTTFDENTAVNIEKKEALALYHYRKPGSAIRYNQTHKTTGLRTMQNIVIKIALVAILFSTKIQANTTQPIHDPINKEDDALVCTLYAAIASINMPTSSLKSSWNSKSYTWLEHAAGLGKKEETSPKTINKTVDMLRKQPKNKLMNFSVEAYKSANCYQIFRREN